MSRGQSPELVKVAGTDPSLLEDVTAAIERIWADLRTWIFEKHADKPKKSKQKAKKTKK